MINLDTFIKMINAGAKILDIEYDYINDLNVFPVPDGDTGLNMRTTVNGAIDSVNNTSINNFKKLADVFARGLLMNARGNSGVIFSQIIRGFVSHFNEEQNELNVADLQQAFLSAKEKAYNAVANPIEGTILTVIRCMAEQVNSHEYKDCEQLFADATKIGQETLDKTPDMLEELKEVGVVDSGGYGLMCFIKGMNAELNGTLPELVKQAQAHSKDSSVNFDSESFKFFDTSREEEGFGYCSEIVMTLGANINPSLDSKKIPFNLETFRKELERIGNSLVCVQDADLVKVHVHTMKPYRLLQIAQKYGEFDKVKFENMTNQYYDKAKKHLGQDNAVNEDKAVKPKKLKDATSLIVTVPTKKIAKFFKADYGVENLIITEDNGAPSIQTFVDKLYKAECKNAFIITDDSNIILSANEALKLVAKNIKVSVIPGKNLFESLVAITNFDKDASYKNNYKDMMKSLKKTISAVISTSIKDVDYSHIKVKTGNKIGIIDKKIIVADNSEVTVLKKTLDALMKNKKGLDICYVIYGANATISAIRQFEKYASEQYGLYCEIQSGNQKVYDYYIGLQ